MQDIPDCELLRQFGQSKSDEAFSELVRRHINLVYSVALRHTANAHHAQEITQAVFIILARKAASLGRETVLSGWLYHTARLTAANFRRAEISHVHREQEAYVQSTVEESSPEALWRELAPVLDEAMAHLDATDRDAVVLRYFENQDLRTVGTALGISDDAAQKRVSRAVERLREFLAKRGLTIGASGLAVAITANAVQAAPIGLAATIATAAALAGTAIAINATAAKVIAMTTLQKTLVTATVVAAVGTGIYEARQAAHLREQDQMLQQQQAPLSEQIQQLTRDRDESKRQLAALRDENERLNRNTGELLKLRAEVTRLRNASQELALKNAAATTGATNTNDVIESEGKALIAPTVRFGSYIDAAGAFVSGKSHQATFEFENPSASLVICAFHQPGGPRDMNTGGPLDAFISLQPNSTNRVLMLVGGTNAETLSVTMMRAVSSRELSVPVP